MSVTEHDRAPAVQHATLVFERELPAPITAVFEAYADATLRARWGAPSETAVIIYDAEDFREGGMDRFRCGSRQDPNIHVVTHYLEIIVNRRIVCSESITTSGRRLCAALTTVEFVPLAGRTRLKNTIQVASFIGAAMIEGHKVGQAAALDNLVRYFEDQGAA
ncbi:SRPBCC domain-containing protein [Hylemonella sp. W303a]|uniref:SRPBCC domain-containing protein n=1 Tax=Hylemonella sp. W303a TaxID=3389873 RepID=UPI00396B1DFD